MAGVEPLDMRPAQPRVQTRAGDEPGAHGARCAIAHEGARHRPGGLAGGDEIQTRARIPKTDRPANARADARSRREGSTAFTAARRICRRASRSRERESVSAAATDRTSRKAGDRVELAQQPGDQLLGVVLRAELLELIEHSRERRIGVGDGALREVLAQRREALAMPREFGAIEIGVGVGGSTGVERSKPWPG